MKLSLLFNIALLPLAVAAVVMGIPNQALGAAFSGNFSGSWVEPTPGSINTDPIYDGVGTEEFTWGDPSLFENASSNKLMFAGSSLSSDTNSLFKIGDLTYQNGTVLLGTSVEYVPLKVEFSLEGSTNANHIFEYGFKLENTPNLSENPELNADYLLINEKDRLQNFIHNGEEYTFTLTGFSHDNGNTHVKEFRVLEGNKTTTSIFGKIDKVTSSKKVPEPGLLIGLSAFSAYSIYRKKSTKAE